MPTGTQLLAAALEEVLASLVHGIGDAQKEMDRSTIALQREIDADPQLAVHGVQATWYQVPKTEIELRVALTIDNPPAPSTPGSAVGTPQAARWHPAAGAAPSCPP